MAKTMKAWAYSRSGLPSEILILATLPIPPITSDTQIRVKVSHCALNPGGSIIMQLLPFFFRAPTAIPEMDFSGIIEALGSAVPAQRGLATGDRVFGSIPVSQHVRSVSGSLAEYVVVDCTAVEKTPDSEKQEEVSGLGIAGATALELIKAAKLKRGDSVLVNGASGGIGHLVMQMCRTEVGETGKVVAICSNSNVGWVKGLGANEVIDYNEHAPVQTYLEKAFGASRFNCVVDAAGIQSMFEHSPKFLAEGKPYVTVGPRQPSYTALGMLYTIGLMAKNMLWPRILGGISQPYVQVTGFANQDSLQQLASMVAEGKLRVHIGTRVKMVDVQEAYDQMLSGHAQGKIVVEVESE